jgi:hypothetical protein
MMNMNTKKRLFLGIISLMAVALISGVTVAVLAVMRDSANETASTAIPVVTASDVIDSIEISLTDRSGEDYVVVPREAAQVLDVLLPGNDGVAGYLVPATHVLSLTGASKAAVASVDQSLVSQLTRDGFSHTPTPTDFIDSQFVKASLVCQMNSYAGVEGLYLIDIACTDRADHSQLIQTISEQMTLVPDLDLTAVSYYTSRALTKDGIIVSVVGTTRASDSVASSQLLFVKQSKDAAWQYITDLSSGDPQLSDGKFIQTEVVKQALQNETYGNVLNEFLYGTEPAAQD